MMDDEKLLKMCMEQVVASLNRPGAPVTSETHVIDLLEAGDAPGREKRNLYRVQGASIALDVDVAESDLVVEVARRRKEYLFGGRR
jgi:hypothetical protein